MKKSDLKTGMWVELRNGNKFVVLKDCETKNYGIQYFAIVAIGDTEFDVGTEYYDDLKNRNIRDNDIVKIYGDEPGFVNACTFTVCPPLLWERQENTYLDDFLEKFPNIETDPDGRPVKHICLRELYLHRHFNCDNYSCSRGEYDPRPCCWDQPLGSLENAN